MKIDLNTKISEYFGNKELKGSKYGLELEYENARLSSFDPLATPLTRWKLEKDNSLRNHGIEFVSKPTSMDSMEVTIDQMLAAATSLFVRATSRCGLHVHVNMTDRTFRDLFNVSVLYTLLEPIIFAEYADGRQASHFCVPTYSNTVLVDNLYSDMQRLRRGIDVPDGRPRKAKALKMKMPQFHVMTDSSGDIQIEPLAFDAVAAVPAEEPTMMSTAAPVNVFPPLLQFCHVPKYAAVNYSALRKFGTIEYRQHPSTLSKGELLEWVGLIHRLHVYAAYFTDPLEIIQLYDADGLFTLCEKVGLKQTKEVDQFDLEDAVDAATMMAGHEPVKWQELKWEIA